MLHPPGQAGRRRRRGPRRGAGAEDAAGGVMLRQNEGKSCPPPEGGDGKVLAFELDDFDGTVVGRLSDAFRMFL